MGVFILFCLLINTVALPQERDKISPQLLDLIKENSGEIYTAWVYFKDKGPYKTHRLQKARDSLSIRSKNRRLRHGFKVLVDEYDLSVYRPYLESVKKYATKVRLTSRWLNAVSLEVQGNDVQKIADFPFVKKIEKVKVYSFRKPTPPPSVEVVAVPPEAELHVHDYGPSFNQVEQMNVPVLHDMGYNGQGILICMLDSGFNNLNHQALDHLDIVATWDFVNQDAFVFDEEGQMGTGDHGTNTLGAIGGYRSGELIGPAFGASFILGKTENTEWERHMEEDHWVAGAEWADSLGADIISSSLGYRNQFTHGESDYNSEDMDGETTVVAQGANIAASRGILIVNSAGNEGAAQPPDNTIISPADSPWVLAAGAVDPQGDRVDFSSTGPTADGRIKPDVMAQGSSVYTAHPEESDGYEYTSGTSFSCPLTAGVAALILEMNPTWTNQDIMDALKLTSKKANDPDNRYGYGIINAFKAARFTLKSIHAPDSFALQRMENNYGFFVQYVDQLSWESDQRNNGRVSSYRIYAKSLQGLQNFFVLIREVNHNVFSFARRGLLEDETFLYKIVSVDKSGKESDPTYTRW